MSEEEKLLLWKQGITFTLALIVLVVAVSKLPKKMAIVIYVILGIVFLSIVYIGLYQPDTMSTWTNWMITKEENKD